jgi:hypothetical protein
MITSGGRAAVSASPSVRPSRRWYWVAGGTLAVALISIALAVAGFFSLNRQIKDFQRVRVPGQAEVTFAQPGNYVLYIEGPGQCCSLSAGSGDSAPFSSWSMNMALQPVNGDPPVSIHTWQSVAESYGVAGHQGQAAMYVTVSQSGRYLLAVSNVVPGAITDVAVGRGIGHGMLWLLLALVALFVLIPAGLVVGGVTFFRRRRARRNPLKAPQVMQPNGNWSAMTTPIPARLIPPAGQPGLSRLPVSPARIRLPVSPARIRLPVSPARIRLPVSPARIRLPVSPAHIRLPVSHDIDKSGWWVLIGLVPFVGGNSLRSGGQARAARVGGAHASGSRVPSTAASATSVRRRFLLRA